MQHDNDKPDEDHKGHMNVRPRGSRVAPYRQDENEEEKLISKQPSECSIERL